jgi:SHS2 domain-containing protein
MPYEYLSDIALSDVAFRAWGDSIDALFVAAADATLNVMVEDLNSVENRLSRRFQIRESSEEMLLFSFLQELIFLKDAEQLLLRIPRVDISREKEICSLSAEAAGENLNPLKHQVVADVKAVTLYRFNLKETLRGWEATVVLDI